MLFFLAAVATVAGACSYVDALENGLARTPPMGWNSWNHFACNVNETVVAETIDAVASSGLGKLGYVHVDVDDCWAYARTPEGKIVADPQTFPNGMAALAARAHARGLRFGLYSDAGTQTCAGRPGSLGFEKNDATTYASWGVDVLKYDNCHNMGIPPEDRYPPMTQALNASGRAILFMACEWGVNDPAKWMPELANSWRTTPDIKSNWPSVISRADLNDVWWKYAAPGGWNDPDMLEVGNTGLTNIEARTHFALWCLMKAPLLLGCDVRNLSTANPEAWSILTNADAIAVNQDPLGEQGHKVWKSPDGDDSTEVWAGRLSPTAAGKRRWVALLLNRGAHTASSITGSWSDIGIPDGTLVRGYNIDTHSPHHVAAGANAVVAKNVPSHGATFLTLTEA